ncbi:OsmC family peroxiredoxin [Rubellimicrobium sp. CFH 75288]|uniref:OsmC family peroxiredoxin n=1 Tax=Rubellimicrobium sp. CFH 75288 TaxID=2697034 RepID=UPI001412DF4D|nr:OsmC family peroxiredoxin [Rubellimicrobium sp. CFH 75288]NAZ35791.1 OsmC family peroxiredoxin [Rubellimicrobium sp. CFH 75288]
MIRKHGKARWQGNLREGRGTVSTETGSLADQAYSFARRFGEERGTNPEELIGAAHAACYAMAMSAGLEKEGLVADSIDATSTVTLETGEGGAAITRIHLDVVAAIPGATEEVFQRIAEETKSGCPVSRLLAGAEITLDARLA